MQRNIIVYLDEGEKRSCKAEILREDDLFLTFRDSHGTVIRVRRVDVLKVLSKDSRGMEQ